MLYSVFSDGYSRKATMPNEGTMPKGEDSPKFKPQQGYYYLFLLPKTLQILS